MKLLPRCKHIKYSFLTTILGFCSGLLFLINPLVGLILFVVDIIIDAKIMETLDFSKDIAKTENGINQSKKEIQIMLNEIKNTRNEIKEIKKQTFDTFSKRGFLTIEQRIKELEDAIGLGCHNNTNLDSKLNKLVDAVNELEEQLGVRFKTRL